MNTLVAKERNEFKKTGLKRMRSNGEIPAVVYGSDIHTKSIFIKNSDLQKVVKNVGRNGIISLNLDGNSKNVILRDYQNEPLKKEILHVDFLQVNSDTELDTKVSVLLKGTSHGEKSGGVVKQLLHELDITAKASDIPDTIEIDMTDFELGHAVRIADIKKAYDNCTINHEEEETIVIIDYVKPVTEEEDASEVEN